MKKVIGYDLFPRLLCRHGIIFGTAGKIKSGCRKSHFIYSVKKCKDSIQFLSNADKAVGITDFFLTNGMIPLIIGGNNVKMGINIV